MNTYKIIKIKNGKFAGDTTVKAETEELAFFHAKVKLRATSNNSLIIMRVYIDT